ncbi:MAG: ATP-binding cassette domain-containing protein [Candidatus Marinimicrobia bacterium]|nr:ATP-binding cassette domain-containing protein [Candidatus Neomarinimicrobiota bacterium]
MIRVENLVKHYGDVKAVRSINFKVNDGEILGFLGANGAGKTTTLRIITGYLSPTAGNVYVNDLNIAEHSLEIRKQIGYLAELNPLYLDMRVFDLLEFTAQIREIEGKDFRNALTRVIEQCGLSGILHRTVAECSKGYRQRIGLATAIMHDPQILIMDEPVSGLDPNQIVEIRELIKELGKEKLVIISSHILQEIKATVDRIAIIHEGKIIADGTSQELMASFRGKTQLTLEVKGTTAVSLKSLPDAAPEAEITSTVTEGDRTIINLEYSKDADPREALFKHAVKSKWTLLEMSTSKAQLEDIFRMLTVKGGGDA